MPGPSILFEPSAAPAAPLLVERACGTLLARRAFPAGAGKRRRPAMLSLLLASLIAPAFVRPQPCVALQESVPAVAAQGAGAAEDEFARLVPNEACFVVRARSLQRLYDSAREVMRGIAKDSEFPSMQSMLDRLGSHADASQIALDQPIGLALAVDAQGETSITLIVPALDAAALSASIEDPDPKAKKFTLGKFVVVSDAPNYAPNKSPTF